MNFVGMVGWCITATIVAVPVIILLYLLGITGAIVSTGIEVHSENTGTSMGANVGQFIVLVVSTLILCAIHQDVTDTFYKWIRYTQIDGNWPWHNSAMTRKTAWFLTMMLYGPIMGGITLVSSLIFDTNGVLGIGGTPPDMAKRAHDERKQRKAK